MSLTFHENVNECNCLFCTVDRLKCPECGTVIKDFKFSVSYSIFTGEDSIWIHNEGISFKNDDDDSFVCPECYSDLPKKFLRKLSKALLTIAGDDVKVNRDEEGQIELDRFVVKAVPDLREV